MTSKIITILLGISILILGLIYGSPFEITYQPAHRFGTLILSLIIGILFFFLLRQSLRLRKIGLILTGLGLTVLVSLPYLYIGLWTIPSAIASDEYPLLKDISIYTNENGEKIIGQFIEISGSLHHYQNRKIIYDFENGMRLSYIYPDEKIEGKWKVQHLEFENILYSVTDTTYTAEFINGREIE